jgi:hypothetical protein
MAWTILSARVLPVLFAASLIGAVTPAFAEGPSRFEAVAVESIPSVSGLQVVTIKDNARNACYTTFVMRPPQELNQAPSSRTAQAAAARDQRLAELSAAFEKATLDQIPGTAPGPNALAYQWEAEKALNTFALTVIDEAVDRLLNELRQVLADQKPVVVSADTCPAN